MLFRPIIHNPFPLILNGGVPPHRNSESVFISRGYFISTATFEGWETLRHCWTSSKPLLMQGSQRGCLVACPKRKRGLGPSVLLEWWVWAVCVRTQCCVCPAADSLSVCGRSQAHARLPISLQAPGGTTYFDPASISAVSAPRTARRVCKRLEASKRISV